MIDRVLIDTSIWIEFLRGSDHESVVVVSELLRQGRVVLGGPVLTELLQGSRDGKEMAQMAGLLKPLEWIHPSDRFWEEAGYFSQNLRRKGVVIPTLDVLIATLALQNNCRVFTKDKHFLAIAKHSSLKLYP